MNVWTATSPVAVPPSLKSQAQLTTLPSSSEEVLPSKETASGALPVLGAATAAAVGGRLFATETEVDSVVTAPLLSRTLRVTT